MKNIIIVCSLSICLPFLSCSPKQSSREQKETAAISTIETKRIGKEGFGYVSVPKEWVRFQDVEGGAALQYSDSQGKYIVSLNDGKTSGFKDAEQWANHIMSLMKQYGSKNFKGAMIDFKGYSCYQCYGNFPDGTYWIVNIFTLENEEIRYFSFEGPNDGDTEGASKNFMAKYDDLSGNYGINE